MKPKIIFLIFLLFTICCESTHALPEGAFMQLGGAVAGGSVSISPDGKLVALESWENILLWDVQTGEFLRKIEGRKASFSSDGKTVASVSGDEGRTITLWDTTTGALLRKLEGQSFFSSIAFSPDGKTIAGGGWDGIIFLWDATTGKVLRKLEGQGSFHSFSSDGKTLASGSWDGTVLLWNVSENIPAVEPKGKHFITLGGLKRTMLLQNYPNPFNPETWIPFQLVEAAEVTIRIYDIAGREVRTLPLGRKSAGFYIEKADAPRWDGTTETGEHVASGVYFYTLQAGDFGATKRLVVVK